MEKNIFKLKKFFDKVIIIDASVLIKVFLEEKESDYANELIGLHIDRRLTLLSTHLLTFELLNILIRHLQSESNVNKAYQEFKLLQIGLIPLESPVIKKAIYLANKDKKISFYDAAYHALAKHMEATFLTADRKYYELMKKEGNIELFT